MDPNTHISFFLIRLPPPAQKKTQKKTTNARPKSKATAALAVFVEVEKTWISKIAVVTRKWSNFSCAAGDIVESYSL